MSMWERRFHHPDLIRFLESSDSGPRSPSATHADGHNTLNSLKWNILLADHNGSPSSLIRVLPRTDSSPSRHLLLPDPSLFSSVWASSGVYLLNETAPNPWGLPEPPPS